MLTLLADENLHGAIVRGLRRRRVDPDVVRVQDVGLSGASDPEVLEWAAQSGRVLLTRDIRTMTRHAWARVEEGFPMFRQMGGGLAVAVVLLAAPPATADPKPAEAAFASLAVPGLGQVLNHQEGKGLLMFGGTGILLSLAAVDAIGGVFDAMTGERHRDRSGLLLTAALGVWIYSIGDACSVARKHRRSGDGARALPGTAPSPSPGRSLQVGIGLLRDGAPGMMVRAAF